MKKNLYKFWTQLNNAITVSDTDFVNRDLSKNYAIFILFLSSSPWSKLRPHGVVGNGNNVKTNWRFHTNRAIPVQQTSTPCFFSRSLAYNGKTSTWPSPSQLYNNTTYISSVAYLYLIYRVFLQVCEDLLYYLWWTCSFVRPRQFLPFQQILQLSSTPSPNSPPSPL